MKGLPLLPGGVDRHNVRMLDRRRDPRLLGETAGEDLVRRRLRRDQLQCHVAIETRLDREIEDPHATAAEAALDPVAGELLPAGELDPRSPSAIQVPSSRGMNPRPPLQFVLAQEPFGGGDSPCSSDGGVHHHVLRFPGRPGPSPSTFAFSCSSRAGLTLISRSHVDDIVCSSGGWRTAAPRRTPLSAATALCSSLIPRREALTCRALP